ncbi:MAG: ParB/RepB/Spo0J family partition protein [Dehalococcoidia bacterium]
MRAKGGLGRGLAALIPAGEVGVQQVDVDLIAPNPEQPRGSIDPESLLELTASIHEHGVLQPLIVSQTTLDSGTLRYCLIAGERRLQAARLAGLEQVPVVVREVTSAERLELALVENLQRADLSPLEEAFAYRRLVDEFRLTQEEVGRRVGRGRVAVANSIRLLGLDEATRARLAEGKISEGHARALLGTDGESARAEILQHVVDQGLSVRQTESLVKAVREADQPRRVKAELSAPDREAEALEERLRAALATQVQLLQGRRGGRIVIRYYNDEDLQELLAVLLRGRT